MIGDTDIFRAFALQGAQHAAIVTLQQQLADERASAAQQIQALRDENAALRTEITALRPLQEG